MTEPITKQELIDASEDALTLEDVVNGDDVTDVTSRLARTYPTLAKALRLIVENGLLGATPFNLRSEMDLSALVDDDYAVVTDDPTPANNGFYQKQSGVFEFLAWNPINQFLAALAVEVADRAALIDEQAQFDGLVFANSLGFVLFSIDQLSGTATSSRAEFGTVAPSAIEFGQSQIIGSTAAELEVINALGFTVFTTEYEPVYPVDIAVNANTLLVSPDLIAWAGERVGIQVAQLVADRVTVLKQRTLTASLLSNSPSNAFNDTSAVVLDYKPKNTTTASAIVHVYDSVSQQNTSATISRCASAPLGSSTAIKVLMIGDSITNRGGADCVRSSLIAHGYTPTMLGTITGTAFDSASAANEGGHLGEGREGSQIQHHLYVYTSRAAVAVGDEATYLALSKADKANRNPFVRLATGGDNSAYVFNSHIFDMRFYLDRFGIADPDVVYINLGTNDITAFDSSTSPTLATATDRIKIMILQTRAALPSAGIVIALPSPAIDGGTLNTRWTDKYTAAIAQLKTTIAALADSKVYLCPEWAVMPATAGFAYTGTAVSDGIHPLTTGRVIKYDIAAAYIAAAKAGV